MREFELTIDEAFKKGLSPMTNPPINTQWMKECLGFRCADDGLEAHEELSNPLPSTLSLDYTWPYPQMLIGDTYAILVVRDSITGYDSVYTISEDHQTVVLLFEIQPILYSATLMEIADFGKYVFLTNGAAMIYWDGESKVWQVVIDSDTIPTMRTVCNFKGQAVGGCVLSSWHDCDETFYIWSQIGSMDFTINKDNEAGYRRCPYGGEVYHTRRLGNAIVGYSAKGITLIYPASSKTPEYGTGATFGFRGLDDIGLINRGAVNGDLQRQVYVGDDYILREVTEKGVNELGYQSYMEQLAGEDVIVSYDPSERNFYIGNSLKTFLLSPHGMTEVLQHPSAVWRRNKQTYMLPNNVDVDSPYVCTHSFDMTYRGAKTTFSIETDAFLGLGKAGIDWTNDASSWGTEYYKSINNQGIAPIIVSGNSFRFRLKFDTLNTGARINYMKIRYKMTDLRGLRGVYAPPPRGQ